MYKRKRKILPVKTPTTFSINMSGWIVCFLRILFSNFLVIQIQTQCLAHGKFYETFTRESAVFLLQYNIMISTILKNRTKGSHPFCYEVFIFQGPGHIPPQTPHRTSCIYHLYYLKNDNTKWWAAISILLIMYLVDERWGCSAARPPAENLQNLRNETIFSYWRKCTEGYITPPPLCAPSTENALFRPWSCQPSGIGCRIYM